MATDEEQITSQFLAELGLAFFNAQALEYGMTSLFAASELMEHAEAALPSLRQIMDTRYSQTLGKLINDAGRQLGLKSEFTDLLRQALQQRNWLVHHFYSEHGHCAFSVPLKLKVTEKLREVRDQLEGAATAVHEEVIARLTHSGKSREELERRAEEITKRHIELDLEGSKC